MFPSDSLTLGIFFAIESYVGPVPSMVGQTELAQQAEALGFAALWVRDVPLLDPSFGDAGQVHDPWVFLGHVAESTTRIALATGGIVLPLRHPLHVAKAAASVDVLSGGRLVLGLAGGDRPVEYPAFGIDPEARVDLYREGVGVVRRALGESFPRFTSSFGQLMGDVDLLPKSQVPIPLLAVGSAGQQMSWLSDNMDGLVTYPRHPSAQREVIRSWGTDKPFAQSLYVDVHHDPEYQATPIHLGYRLGAARLLDHLTDLHSIGVRHVALNLKYGSRPAAEVLDDIGRYVIPGLP